MTRTYSTLAMYPYAGLRKAWEALYRSVAASVAEAFPDTPARLRWDVDAHASWVDPYMVLSQTCGWPLVTTLRTRVRVLGTFSHTLDSEPTHTYRSVIVAREGEPLTSLAHGRAAVNSADSLSGFVSLLDAFGVGSQGWPGEVVWTGAHLHSIEAVRTGHAEVASIDALAWAYHQRLSPDALDGLAVIDRGPLVPCLPVIVAGRSTDALVAAWRAGLAAAMRDPGLAAVRDTLLIGGFVPLDLADYDVALAPLVDQTRSS